MPTPKSMIPNSEDSVENSATPMNLNVRAGDPIPEYLTGKWVNTYIATLDPVVKARFDKLKILRMIEIPDTDVALRTAQTELFMDAL